MGLDGEDSLLPEEFEEYRLVRLLGAGAMGRVYLAEDRLLERPVAIKLIGARSPTEAARERFYNEARAVARLTHPNVVTIHRVGEARGRPFLVSELVRGESLDKLALPLPATRLRSIALGLARGLAAAHRRGVLHRDLKPANAMLSSDGEVKLLDFGLAQMMTDAAIPLSTRGDAGDGARPSATARSADPDATASLDEPAAHGSDPDTDTVRVDTLPGSGPAEPRRGIVGTPRYLAPEIWLGEPHSTRSDVYSLGALLYKLYTGRAPHHGASLYELARVATEVDVAPAVALGEEDARLARVIDRCLARDPDARLGSGEAVREALERLDDPAPVAGSAPPGNPYRGLLPFEAEHRGLFFGRSAEVRALLDRLRAEPMVVVAAESGAGKSSICRAGVLGAVAEGALGEAWTAVTVSPGSRPLRALAEALSPLVEGRAPDVEDRLRDEPGAIGRELRRRCAGKVLVVIDPLEALVTQASEDEARAAAEALGALAEHGGARVLAAARSDFLARLATLPMLGEALPRSLFLLRPIASELLREVVVGPARAAGFSFESDALVDALIEGAAGAGGGLPLLGFTLAALWDARDAERRIIPAAALDALGGVSGALARHADGVIASLRPPDRAAARSILLSLVTAEGMRARRTEAELLGRVPAGRAALEALVRGRLLVMEESEHGDGGTCELAHEALIGGWDTLRGWLGDDAGKRAVRQRLERAASEWERLGRAGDALLGERMLDEVSAIDLDALGDREARFLSASRRAARRRRAARWAGFIGGPLAILLTAASVWGMVAAKAARARQAEVEAHLAEGERALREAAGKQAEAGALRQEAFTRFDAGDASADHTWTSALDAARKADALFSTASQAFDLALKLDGRSQRARDALAAALVARADLAGADHQAALRDELLARVSSIDGGAHARTLAAPARLTIETSPPGAEIHADRYLREDGHRKAVPLSLRDPLASGASIAPGSILLHITAPGRAPVRLPLLLAPGEERRIRLDLPLASDVPPGFVYLPPGRFLYGNTGGEIARQLFTGPPEHPVEAGALLVADHETTYAEWIAFLRALPAEERARRMPSARGQSFVLDLTALPDGDFQLTFGPEKSPQRARTNEPLPYPGRTRRAAQRWLNCPVSGVSFEDALAYLAWLDHNGQVPGARLCDEREWERAARGADDRPFPGGDRLDPDDANHDQTYGGDPAAFGPDEVGSHPTSDSPFGIHDMAGNVWEWTTAVGRPGAAIVRGGSFYQLYIDSTSYNREPVFVLSHRSVLIGVRACATPRPR